MGADLISITIVGPKTLKPSKAKVDKVVHKTLKRVKACAEWDGGVLPRGFDYEDDVQKVADYDEQMIRDLVGGVVTFWNDPRARDTAWRFAKVGNKAVRIVVAGGTSWGDSPDGEGYELLMEAERLGLLDSLGLH